MAERRINTKAIRNCIRENRMKTSIGFIGALLALALFSCSRDSSVVQPVMESETLIGGIGSQRVYTITESWFIPGTDTPFVAIPDSLAVDISVSDSLRRLGVVRVTRLTETVIPFDSSFYAGWQLPLPIRAYKMTMGIGQSLSKEFRKIWNYQQSTSSEYQEQCFWLETADEVQQVLPAEMLPRFPALPWLKKPLCVNDSWLRYEYIDTYSRQATMQRYAKVMAIDSLSVKAGTFSAYRLAVYDGGVLPELANEFEYYVPDIGLVLYKVDWIVNVVTLYPGGSSSPTITIRQVIRKELTSYNVVR